MEYLKSLTNNVDKKSLLFYIIYALLLLLLLFGATSNIHASAITAKRPAIAVRQYRQQSRPVMIRRVQRAVPRYNHRTSWFRDGLNNRNFHARGWISWHESRNRWNVLSYGHRCIGYFQLDPRYLGRRHGHVNLNHHHQVRVADRYARSRYGDWVHAKRFWQVHHWY